MLAPGEDEIGWFATHGPVPLGYLGDEAKTRATFPVVVGERWSVPGDRARHRADGTVGLLGRDSVTINSGGEKVFADEVAQGPRDRRRRSRASRSGVNAGSRARRVLRRSEPKWTPDRAASHIPGLERKHR